MKRFLWQGFLTALALLLAAPWAESSFFQHIKAYEHPDLEAGKVSVHSVRILPFEVKSRKKAAEIHKALASSIASVLQQHGCTVLKSMFTEKALAANTDLKYTLADLEKQFDTLDAKIERKPKDVQEGRYTMGYVVNKLNPGGTADALVFVRGSMLLKTQRVLLESASRVVFYAEIAVVDARTGNVLYYIKLTDENVFAVVKKPGRLATPVTKAFKKFPGTSKN